MDGWCFFFFVHFLSSFRYFFGHLMYSRSVGMRQTRERTVTWLAVEQAGWPMLTVETNFYGDIDERPRTSVALYGEERGDVSRRDTESKIPGNFSKDLVGMHSYVQLFLSFTTHMKH